MKARFHGAIYCTWKKIDIYFGCRLEATNLNQTDNLSHALQKPTLSTVEAHDLALKVLAVLRNEQSNVLKNFGKRFCHTKIHMLSGKSCNTIEKKDISTL